MDLKDSISKYGWLSKLLHWVIAFTMFGLFFLGYWMRTLDYYSPYYQTAPHIHESIGLLMFIVVPVFMIWRYRNKNPSDKHLKPYERLLAGMMKKTLYLLMLVLLITGYLLATVGDTPVAVFNWFEIPALFIINDSKLLVGNLHEYFAYILMVFAVFHASAALKHHFVDRDNTLKRILPFIKIQETQEKTNKDKL